MTRKKYYYYFALFLKKLIIFIHNTLEVRMTTTTAGTIEEFQFSLWKELLLKLKPSKEGYYYETKVTNKKSPMVLSQARVILILCNNYKHGEFKFRSKFLISQLSDYLISMRQKNGIYNFNQASWNLQDEGIASVWATLALIKSYEITNNVRYLESAKLTMYAMLDLLYSNETSLKHTLGDDFWCLNSASTFAYVCSLFLKYNFDERIQEAMANSINICIDKIADDGHFPYNKSRQGTYLLLYHPIVMITLEYCLESKHLTNVTIQKLREVLAKARVFLINCINSHDEIFEPEVVHYSQYIITGITSLLALKGKIDLNSEEKMLQNIATYWTVGKLYLCKDKKGRLYNSDLYSVKDVLLIEVLYWLDLYLTPSI